MIEPPTENHPFTEADELFQMERPSRLENREEMIQEILTRLEQEGCNPDPYFDRLSLDEILSNAILHGNSQDPRKLVKVRVFSCKDRWGFEVSDEGKGFPWRDFLKKLKMPLDQTQESGRGLALVLFSGAELHFLDEGRRVVVVRHKEKPAAKRKEAK